MFIKKVNQLTHNFTKKTIFFYPKKVSSKHYIHYFKKSKNNKLSWYRKKKKTPSLFYLDHTSHFLNRYMVLSKMVLSKGRKYYDIRMDSYGQIYSHISSWGLIYKTKVFNFFTKPKYYYLQLALYGQKLTLKNLEISYIFHHLWLTKNYCIATSPGTYIRILSLKQSGLITLLLPSKKIIKTFNLISYIVGRNDGVHFSKLRIAKAGSKLKDRNFVKVRGIAKNPVDHPNGGNANTKGSLRNPWGRIAKFNK